VTKTIPKKKKCKKAKWLSEVSLQIPEERREANGKGERERDIQLKAEFQRIAKRVNRAFFNQQYKGIEENHRIGQTRDLFKKIGDRFISVAQSCPALCDPMECSMPGFPVCHQSWNMLKLMSIELVMPSNYLILCYPLLLLPSVFPDIRVFSKELVLRIRWPKYWSLSFSICPSNEYSELFPLGLNDLISL